MESPSDAQTDPHADAGGSFAAYLVEERGWLEGRDWRRGLQLTGTDRRVEFVLTADGASFAIDVVHVAPAPVGLEKRLLSTRLSRLRSALELSRDRLDGCNTYGLLKIESSASGSPFVVGVGLRCPRYTGAP